MSGPLYVSSSAIPGSRVADVIDECERRGITHLELTSSLRHYSGLWSEVIEARARGLQLLLHNYFPPPAEGFVINLASSDSDILSRSLDHCRSALALSAEVGAPYYSVHAGFALDPRASDLGGQLDFSSSRSLTEAATTFYAAVAELLTTADQYKIDLLIENNVLAKRNLVAGRNTSLLCVTAEDMLAFMAAVPHPRLGLLLDVGHLKVSSDTLGQDRNTTIAAVRPHVRALHLSDNNGRVDDNRPFARDAWFMSHLGQWPNPICVIETRPLDAASLAACIAAVNEARSRPAAGPTTGEGHL